MRGILLCVLNMPSLALCEGPKIREQSYWAEDIQSARAMATDTDPAFRRTHIKQSNVTLHLQNLDREGTPRPVPADHCGWHSRCLMARNGKTFRPVYH